MQPYHDEEWGVPVHDDRRHFEFLILESAQAGLSWVTILKRREGYRQAFCDFDPEAVADFGPADVERLLGDSGIIRNRPKVESAIKNARAFLEIRTRARQLRQLHLGLCQRCASTQHMGATASEIPAETRSVEEGERGPEAAGLQLSRARSSAMPTCRRPVSSWTT